MVRKYTQHVSSRKTPQTQPVFGRESEQAENYAGGYAFTVDKWTRLNRWLILGSESPTYYVGQKQLTLDNVENLVACIKENGVRTVQTITEVSETGRAPKNDPAIFGLAVCCNPQVADIDTRKAAFEAIPKVCRIGTHLFQFCEAVTSFRKFGMGLQKAIRRWYLTKSPRDLAYQVTKYQQRNGWSHRDVLRLVKPKTDDELLNFVLRWSVGKVGEPDFDLQVALDTQPQRTGIEPIVAFEAAKRADSAKQIVRLIENYDLVRECIPTQFLTEPKVWEALLEKMPLMAMVRNLATMTTCRLLKPLSKASKLVCERLADAERIGKSRIHPIALLIALRTYKSGKGLRGSKTWEPVGQVVDALDGAFYLAFQNVEPTGQNWMLCIDISGSMTWHDIAGCPGLTPRDGAAALAMVTAKTEPNHLITAFSCKGTSWYGHSSGAIREAPITKSQRLDDAIRVINGLPAGGTDCSLPILHATENNSHVDMFVVITDNETWAGNIHPFQALRQYRQKLGVQAKLVVMAMLPSKFSIADPKDGGMLDVTGFDASVPALMSEFALGRV